MKKIILYTVFSLVTTNFLFAQNRNVARGAEPGELYMTGAWYSNNNNTIRAVYRITENGKKLTIQYDAVSNGNPEQIVIPAYILADATPGVIYNKQTYYKSSYLYTALWVSFDYGKSWIFREENRGNIGYFGVGLNDSAVYKGGENRTVLLSINAGKSFNFAFEVPLPYSTKEIGYQGCEFIGLGGGGETFYNINYTNNCAYSFTVFSIGNQFVFGQMSSLYPDVYRGGLSGEVYVTSWFSDWSYKVSFSDDYGETFRHVYICEGCSPFIGDMTDTFFMSDREPGVFYIFKVKQIETDNPWIWSSQVCINYYRDYGETLVATYCHDLKQDYGAVCEPVTDLSAQLSDNISAFLVWSDESSLPVKGYQIFRNEELLNNEFATDIFFIDENLPAGEYEYYVVTHYTTGCVSDISNIATVTIEEAYEITFW